MITIKPNGNSFMNTVHNAASESLANNKEVVEFDFNGILCRIQGTYDGEWVERYYNDAFVMEWKDIGPEYPPYTPEIWKQVQIARLESQKKWKEREISMAQKEIERLDGELQKLA